MNTVNQAAPMQVELIDIANTGNTRALPWSSILTQKATVFGQKVLILTDYALRVLIYKSSNVKPV